MQVPTDQTVDQTGDQTVDPTTDAYGEDHATGEQAVVDGALARRDTGDAGETLDRGPGEPRPVLVRRRGLVFLVLALAYALMAALFLTRAVTDSGTLDGVLAGLLVVGTLVLWMFFFDSREDLLAADDRGIRMRLGGSWRGMFWLDLQQVEVRERRGLRDGRLLLRPLDPEMQSGLLGRTERLHARVNELLYGAPFALPITITTRVLDGGPDLLSTMIRLADGRCPVVAMDVEREAVVDEEIDEEVDGERGLDEDREAAELAGAGGGAGAAAEAFDFFDQEALETTAIRSTDRDAEAEAEAEAGTDGGAGDGSEVDTADDADDADRPAATQPVRPILPPPPAEPTPSPIPSPTPWPVREPQVAVRSDVALDRPSHAGDAGDAGDAASEDTQPWELAGLRSMDETGQWRASTVVIDDLADLPAVEPVIGPVLADARRVLRLDVDQLADRTRIRPHVIEAIEIDDFAPCGGDFYARGHLRTLARVLGVDVAPLLETYDERYADAPIDPRRVFEADLAAGGRGGPLRSTRGGPNWSVLVAAVMTLVLAWSVARLVMDDPGTTPAHGPTLADDSAGLASSRTKASPVPVVLTAAGGGAHVVVRDGSSKVVFTGDLAFGQSRTLQVAPPVRIQSSDGSVRVSVQGKDQGALGKTGHQAEHVFSTN